MFLDLKKLKNNIEQVRALAERPEVWFASTWAHVVLIGLGSMESLPDSASVKLVKNLTLNTRSWSGDSGSR